MPFFVNLSKPTIVSKVLLFIVLPLLSNAQQVPQRGQISDSIAVSKTKGETFALYLPNSYDPKIESPILFIFDPGGRGRLGIHPFIASSEKYGIILICSNNAKNGPYEQSLEVANNLFNHVFEKYKVNVDQMFLSGFSGGSRLATAIATLSNQFAGVFACGAGFSHLPSHVPSTQGFLYAGICGVEDMNYLEMLSNDQYLSKLGFEHTIISFNGGHQWPPMAKINSAFDWMLLNLQKSKEALKIDASLEQQFRDHLNQAIDHKDKGEYLFASEHYQRLLEGYPKELVLKSIVSDYNALLGSREYLMATKQRNQALSQEKKISQKLFGRLREDLEKPQDMNWKWWSKQINGLEGLKATGNKEEQHMVSRVKYALAAFIYENKSYYSDSSNLGDNTKIFHRFRELLYPKKEDGLR